MRQLLPCRTQPEREKLREVPKNGKNAVIMQNLKQVFDPRQEQNPHGITGDSPNRADIDVESVRTVVVGESGPESWGLLFVRPKLFSEGLFKTGLFGSNNDQVDWNNNRRDK